MHRAGRFDRRNSFVAHRDPDGGSDQDRFARASALQAGTSRQKRPPIYVDEVSLDAHRCRKRRTRLGHAGDDRTTRVGRIIRKIRVDEIPQFWNILRGDMNFVGPRPERPHFVAQLARRDSLLRATTSDRAGPDRLGADQISVRRIDRRCASRNLQYDLYYIKNQNLVLDATIMFETIKTILSGRGT